MPTVRQFSKKLTNCPETDGTPGPFLMLSGQRLTTRRLTLRRKSRQHSGENVDDNVRQRLRSRKNGRQAASGGSRSDTPRGQSYVMCAEQYSTELEAHAARTDFGGTCISTRLRGRARGNHQLFRNEPLLGASLSARLLLAHPDGSVPVRVRLGAGVFLAYRTVVLRRPVGRRSLRDRFEFA